LLAASCLVLALLICLELWNYHKAPFESSVEYRGLRTHDHAMDFLAEVTAVDFKVAVFAGRKASYRVSNATYILSPGYPAMAVSTLFEAGVDDITVVVIALGVDSLASSARAHYAKRQTRFPGAKSPT
jgi:hypothetical protein